MITLVRHAVLVGQINVFCVKQDLYSKIQGGAKKYAALCFLLIVILYVNPVILNVIHAIIVLKMIVHSV